MIQWMRRQRLVLRWRKILRSRNLDDVLQQWELWLVRDRGGLTIRKIVVCCESLAHNMGWPTWYFLPEDPIAVILFAADDLSSIDAVRESVAAIQQISKPEADTLFSMDVPATLGEAMIQWAGTGTSSARSVEPT